MNCEKEKLLMSDNQNAAVKMWGIFHLDGKILCTRHSEPVSGSLIVVGSYERTWLQLSSSGYTCHPVYLYDKLQVQQPEGDAELLRGCEKWIENQCNGGIGVICDDDLDDGAFLVTRLHACLAAGNTEGGEG